MADVVVRPEELRLAARTGGAATLPPELLAEGVRRLGRLSLLVAVLMGVSVVTYFSLTHGPGAVWRPPGFVLVCGIARVVLPLGMWAATRRRGADPEAVLDQGLLFLVLMGFLIAVPYHALPRPDFTLPRGFSAVAVWLIAYPLVVPSTRGKAVLAILATAAMDPLGLLVNLALGVPRPTVAELGGLFLPTVLTTAIAIVSSKIVYGLALEAARGREVGSYRLVAPLGSGGMGEVWRAEHRMLARAAAVKVVRPGKAEGFSGAEMRARFAREAKVTASLRSPHTVQLYDYGTTDEGSFYYAMELLEGFPLDALVARFGPQPPGRVVHVLAQACRSLEEAHRAGLVHRDVKPSNLFLCRLGVEPDFVKVLDFGLVKTRRLDDPMLTATGAVAGTPAFMPPEMALGRAVDARTDLYALGCVAYVLLSGENVFPKTSPLATIHAHVSEAPPPLASRTRGGVPAGLEELVLSCLAKDPERRPPSARALEERLLALPDVPAWTRRDAEAWWETWAAATEPRAGMPAGADAFSAGRE